MSPRHLTAFVVPHTHWDREWYQPFQVFRARLVDVIDRVLESLDEPSGAYRRFTLDGQAVILEDYLEVRSERATAVARLVGEGRLRIGPWFVLADEYLVSPESLVRNLQHGLRTCATFGGALPVAYTPDSFGHVSQLPLLAHGFGLKGIVFERGVGDEGERLGAEFAWLAADRKTAVFAVHLLNTYSAATALGHRDWEYRDAYDPDLALRQVRSALFGPAAGEAAFPVWLHDAVERLPEGLAGYARSPNVLLLNGSDHLFPQANLPAVIEHLDASLETVHFVHSDIEEYVDAAIRPLETLECYQGEFHSGRYHHVLSGVWSTRMPLKQANHTSQTLLERYAEPLLAMAWLGCQHDDRALLRLAWRTLLLNHAHDSICGCSVDAVQRDMETRSAAVDQLATTLCGRALAALTEDAAGPEWAVFQPLPYRGWTVVHATTDVEASVGPRVRVVDAAGRPLPTQRSVERVPKPGHSDVWIDRVGLSFAVRPRPLALTRVRLESMAADADESPPLDPVRPASVNGLVVLENRALRLSAAADGSVALLERASGHEHHLTLLLEDEADAGDSYDFSPLGENGQAIKGRPMEAPRLALAGTLRSVIALRYRLDLPQRLSEDRRGRMGRVSMEVDLELGLEAFSEHVDLTIALENRAEDHRLRLRLATGIRTDHVYADGHWDVLRRPVRPPEAEHWYQRPAATGHQRRFVALSDGQHGIAVLNRGLPEYEADIGPRGTDLCVTLLRCVGWLSRDDLAARPQGAGPALSAPGAQCLGPHRFELALAPFTGRWWDGPLPIVAERFSAPARAYDAGFHDPRPDLAPDNGPTAEARSQAEAHEFGLELTPPLQLSALKLAEAGAGIIVRVWNPADETVVGRLELPRGVDRVFRSRLDETRLEALEFAGDVLELHLGSMEVATLELTFVEEGGDAMI